MAICWNQQKKGLKYFPRDWYSESTNCVPIKKIHSAFSFFKLKIYNKNINYFIVLRQHEKEVEDGSYVGGSWAHLLVHPTGTLSRSSKKQSEQPTES